MDVGLCLCNNCCTEDASETSGNPPSQLPAHDAKQREEELNEKYNEWCASLTKTKEYEEGLEKVLDQGYEFFENKLKRLVKRNFRQISDNEDEFMATQCEEMEKRGEEGFERYMKWTLTGECGSDSDSDGDSDDVSGIESNEEEDEYQDLGDGDWECSAEELEAAMCEDEELFGSLHGDGRHMMQCCM